MQHEGHLMPTPKLQEQTAHLHEVVPNKVRKDKEIEPRSNHPNKCSKIVLTVWMIGMRVSSNLVNHGGAR